MCALFGYLDYGKHVPWRIMQKLVQALANSSEVRGNQKIQKGTENRPKRDRFGRSSVCIVQNFPVPERRQNGARNGNEGNEQRAFPCSLRLRLGVCTIAADVTVCLHPSPYSLPLQAPVQVPFSFRSVFAAQGEAAV